MAVLRKAKERKVEKRTNKILNGLPAYLFPIAPNQYPHASEPRLHNRFLQKKKFSTDGLKILVNPFEQPLLTNNFPWSTIPRVHAQMELLKYVVLVVRTLDNTFFGPHRFCPLCIFRRTSLVLPLLLLFCFLSFILVLIRFCV